MNPKTLYFTLVPFHMLVVLLVASAVLLWRNPRMWPYAFATFCGFLAAFLDLHSDEIQLPALLMLAFSFFLGFTNASSAWRWGLLVGIWIPLVPPLRFVGSDDVFSISGSLFSLMAFAFSFAGAHGGAVLRKLSPVILSPSTED